MVDRWQHGELIIRREILGLGRARMPDPAPVWHEHCWIEWPVYVVEDSADQLVTFTPPGAPFTFPLGDWPIPSGVHPWHGNATWQGHGCLMVQRRGDDHALWHFWGGPERTFVCWYINLQIAYVRTVDGYNTQDLELDIVVDPDKTWELKDDEVMEQRVTDGRFTPEIVRWIRSVGMGLTNRLDSGNYWWDPMWSEWEPDPSWVIAG